MRSDLNAFRFQRFADFTACQRCDRTHIDQYRTWLRAFNNAILTQRHLFHMRGVWQHGYDDVALFSDRFSRRRCFCTCSNHVSNSFWVTVSNHQRVTCFQKVFTHWFTHNPQANKTNFHSHINHLSCCGGGYFLKVSASFCVAERNTPRSLPTATNVAPHSR